MTSIAVTVCTRRRPKMLERCLRSILEQLVSAEDEDMLVVVENDELPHSQDIVKTLTREFSTARVFYSHEPRIGIPIARNHTLDIAIDQGVDWIAFVDDDEQVTEGWLMAMRRAIGSMNAQALTGPVMPIFVAPRPSWFPKKNTKPIANGTLVEVAATNNTMVDLAWLTRQLPPLRFDERLRLSGGSDYDFFIRFVRAGGTIKWVADAVVNEEVPASRLTMQWQVGRKARMQANNVGFYRMHNGNGLALARYLPAVFRRIFLRGIPSCGVACVVWLFSREYGERVWYYGRWTIGSGVGALRGLLGRQFEPYRDIEGE